MDYVLGCGAVGYVLGCGAVGFVVLHLVLERGGHQWRDSFCHCLVHVVRVLSLAKTIRDIKNVLNLLTVPPQASELTGTTLIQFNFCKPQPTRPRGLGLHAQNVMSGARECETDQIIPDSRGVALGR